MDRRYTVVIRYREPGYELVSGPKAEPYRWTYEIVAVDAGEAQRKAVREFRAIEQQSSVGWAREIEDVEISRAAR
jgi:hypothetical protein